MKYPRSGSKRRTAAALLLTAAGALFAGRAVYIFAKAQLAQVLLRSAWRRTLDGAAYARPWPWADTAPVARMTIRGRDFIVLEGANGRNLAFAPSHLQRTAMPGDDGNCVVSAHRDTHFTVLRDLAPGDEIALQRRDGRTFTYTVAERRVVDRKDGWVARDRGTPVLTLITCWPFDGVVGGRKRYVVVATLGAPQDLAQCGAGLAQCPTRLGAMRR